MVSHAPETGEDQEISLSNGQTSTSALQGEHKSGKLPQQQEKRPDYYGLGLKAEAEKQRLSALVSGRVQEGIETCCGVIESALKLTDAVVSQTKGIELSAVKESLDMLQRSRATLVADYATHIGEQNVADFNKVMDEIEQTLRERISKVTSPPFRSSQSR